MLAAPNAGVEAAPKAGVLAAAPKPKDGVLAAPNAGVLAAPKASVDAAAPKAGADVAPKAGAGLPKEKLLPAGLACSSRQKPNISTRKIKAVAQVIAGRGKHTCMDMALHGKQHGL